MIEIEIANEQESIDVDEDHIRRAVTTVLNREGISRAEMSIALVDDARIHEINRQFLDHDRPTDVISFSLSDSPKVLEGEIVLSTDTARREARKVGGDWTPENEVLLYIVHGTLHLTGYDDHEDDDLAAMRRAELECLRTMGVPAPDSLHDRDEEEAA